MNDLNKIIERNLGAISISIVAAIWFYCVSSASIPGLTVNILVFILLFVFASSIKSDGVFLLINSYFIFMTSGVLVSLVLVNHGVYLYELHEFSTPNISLVNNAFIIILIFYAGSIVFKRMPVLDASKYEVDKSAAYIFEKLFIISYTSLGLIFIFFYASGGYAIVGVERFEYWDVLNFKAGLQLSSLMAHLGFLVGIMYVLQRKKIAIYMIIYGVVCLIIAGHKFTGVAQLLFLFLTPILLGVKITKVKFLYFVGLFLIFIICILVLVYSTYISVYGEAAALEILLGRISGQSQMLWAMGALTDSNGYPISDIVKHYFGFGVSDVESGMKYLMYLVAPSDLVTRYLERGIVFTSAGPGSVSLFFGYYAGLLVAILIGIWLGLLSWLINVSIESGNLLASFFSVKAYLNFVVNLTNGGGEWMLDYRIYFYSILSVVFLIKFKKRGYF